MRDDRDNPLDRPPPDCSHFRTVFTYWTAGVSALTYELSDDQKAIQDLIRRVAREKVAPRADEIDSSALYPHDMYELLNELVLFPLPFPSEYGGTCSTLSSCIAVEEFGRVCFNTGYLLVVQW